MKIFMTGMTRLQCDSLKVKTIQKIDVPRIIVNELRKSHSVSWGRCPIKGLDCEFLWANIASCESINSPFSPECLYAIGKAQEQKIPTAIFFDDWQVKIAKVQARKVIKKKEAFFDRTLGDSLLFKKVDLDACRKEIGTIIKGAEIVAHGSNDVVIVIPAYKYVNKDILLNTIFKGMAYKKIVDLDPSSFIEITNKKVENPKRMHTLAALMPHKKWVEEILKPSWEVEYFGSRNLKAPRLKTELDIQMACLENWSILSPPYPQSGSGWWRSRYLYASRLKRLLVCDQKDSLGLPYQVSTRLNEVETFKDSQLKELIQEQSDLFESMIGSSEDFSKNLLSIL